MAISGLNFSSMRATGRRAGGSGGRMSRASMNNYKRSVRSRFSTIFWPDPSKNAIFRTPSKKMRLDESFRMAPVSCHLEVVVKSYGQITKITSPHISPPVLS